MSSDLATMVEPFVRRGLFDSPEQAVAEMARSYILHQIEDYRSIVEGLKAKYGMTYQQFTSYLHARAATLAEHPSPALSQAVIAEEEDALEWKTAREMLSSWLGLDTETDR